MEQPTKLVALWKIDALCERIDELKSWLKENSEESAVAQSQLADGRRDAQCDCGYLSALEEALSLLLDETDSLLKSPYSDDESASHRTLPSNSENIPASNDAAAAAGAQSTDRRIRSQARRRGERRKVALDSGIQGRRRTDRITPKA